MTDDPDIEIRETWQDSVVVVYEDDAELTHRLWCSETEGGKLVALAEILVYDDGRRDYFDEITVPPRVEAALMEYADLTTSDHIMVRRDVV